MLSSTALLLSLLSVANPGGSAPRVVSTGDLLFPSLAGVALAPVEPAFSYDYAQALYSFGDFDGLRLSGAYGLERPWFVAGDVDVIGTEENGVDADLRALALGGGYVHSVVGQERPLDLLATAQLQYGRAKASANGASKSDSELGVRLRGGARYQVTPEVELFGGVSLRTIFDTEFSVDAGLLYDLGNGLGAVGTLEVGDDTVVSLGLRYSL